MGHLHPVPKDLEIDPVSGLETQSLLNLYRQTDEPLGIHFTAVDHWLLRNMTCRYYHIECASFKDVPGRWLERILCFLMSIPKSCKDCQQN